MNVIPTAIPDVLIFEPRVFKDDRGYFFESFRKSTFLEHVPGVELVQANESFSTYGVLRGLHFQKGEHAQGKLVRVIMGEVLDVAVDIRPGSATYGKYVGVNLSEENKRQLWIPRGFAHGFAVLSKEVIFSYQCDNYYNKASEGGIIYNDADINIDWQLDAKDVLLSEKDAILPNLKDIKNS